MCERSDKVPSPGDRITESGSRLKKYFLPEFPDTTHLLSPDFPGWHRAFFISQTSAGTWRDVKILADNEFIPDFITLDQSLPRRRYIPTYLGGALAQNQVGSAFH